MLLKQYINKKNCLIVIILASFLIGIFLRNIEITIALLLLGSILFYIFNGSFVYFTLLNKIVILMMVHTFLVIYFFPKVFNINNSLVYFLTMWKEIFILIIFFNIVYKKRFKIFHKNYLKAINLKYFNLDKAILLFIFICLISLILFPNKVSGLYGIRNYVIGFIVYYIAKNSSFSNKDIYKYIRNISYVLVFISAWGLFQALVLGSKFLIRYGLGNNGKLDDSFYIAGQYGLQRVVGTFDSPNTFALVTLISAIFFIGEIILLNRKNVINIISLCIVLLAITLSFSRSTWIALSICTIIICIFKYGSNYKSYLKVTSTIGKIMIVILLVSVMLFKVMPGVYNRTAGMFVNHIINTFTLRDPSAKGHIASLKESAEFMIRNPIGIGIGKSGPKSVKYNSVQISSESSYFVIGFDLGIPGLVSYLILVFYIIKTILSKTKSDNYYINISAKYLLTMFSGVFVAYLFLPLIQELNHIYITYSILGLLNSNNNS